MKSTMSASPLPSVRGGGIFIIAGEITTECHIVNNTIYDNYATETGGAIRAQFYGGGDVDIHNNICWKNETDEVSGDGSEISLDFFLDGTTTISYCDIEGGGNAIVTYGSGGSVSISYIMDANPTFEDASNADFHLKSTSPCVDSGANGKTGEPPLDYEGDRRKIDGDGDQTVTIDMGADEYDPS